MWCLCYFSSHTRTCYARLSLFRKSQQYQHPHSYISRDAPYNNGHIKMHAYSIQHPSSSLSVRVFAMPVVFSTAQQIISWYAYELAAMAAGLAVINIEPDMYLKYKPRWAPPPWVIWVIWAILHGLQAYAAWAIQDIEGFWSYRLTLYIVYLVSSGLWPVFFFPAINKKLRPMMWVSVVLSGVCLGLSGVLIGVFWDVNPLSGIFMIPSTLWLLYALPLTVVLVKEANNMDGSTNISIDDEEKGTDESTIEQMRKKRLSRYEKERARQARIKASSNGRRHRHGDRIGRCEVGRTPEGDTFFGITDGYNRYYCSSSSSDSSSSDSGDGGVKYM